MIFDEDAARAFCAARLDSAGLARFNRFAELLVAESAHQNLVSNASLNSIWQRHFADSIQLIDHVPRETSCWLDLGTGAGFPGLAIAIARPDMNMVLVESRKKRVDWLNSVIDALSIEKCNVIGTRLEVVPDFPASCISARAFAPLQKLLKLSARFSTPDTTWLLPKGRSAAKELEGESDSVRSMFHVEQSVTDPEAGILIGMGVPQVP